MVKSTMRALQHILVVSAIAIKYLPSLSDKAGVRKRERVRERERERECESERESERET